MFFDIHVFGKACLILNVRTLGDIVSGLQVFQGLVFECKTLLEAAKGKPLMFLIKAIGSGKEATGCKRPSLLVITTIKESFFG